MEELQLLLAEELSCGVARADRRLVNRAGIAVALGSGSGASLFYCARMLGKLLIPGSDGRCGPNNGPQCPDCRGLRQDNHPPPPQESAHSSQTSLLQAQVESERQLRQRAEGKLQDLERELLDTKTLYVQEQQDHQAVKAAFLGELAAHHLTRSALEEAKEEVSRWRAEAARTQLHQEAQRLASKGQLTLDDICVLVLYWQLDIKPEVLRASTLTSQAILQSKAASLKKKLACNYGTTVALVSFLRKLAETRLLVPPRSNCAEKLDTALNRADCPALKPLFLAQGVADDVLFEIELLVLGGADDEIAEHLDALDQAIQSFYFHLCCQLLICLRLRFLLTRSSSVDPQQWREQHPFAGKLAITN
eukprot:m.278341 g.278341  ORF g.278341 m.278341 type:complete len:363 (+) comp54885_c0_seq3:118-1206(+)